NNGLLTSFIVIALLLALLGGSGFGLYYILRAPQDAPTASSENNIAPENEPESKGLISNSITKAKATIASVQETGDSVLESIKEKEPSPEPEMIEPAANISANIPAVVTAVEEPEPPEPPVSTVESNEVSDFLQNAHIGGVRTGARPMLILNGDSYTQDDLVHPDFGLRFIGFRDEKLAFRDDEGIIYVRSF
ncbi:MAG: hypothetical protein ACPGSB_04920, partial [Opitutales bacterium]